MDDLSFYWILAYKYENEIGQRQLSQLTQDYIGSHRFKENGLLTPFTWKDFSDKLNEIILDHLRSFPQHEWKSRMASIGPLIQIDFNRSTRTFHYIYWLDILFELLEFYNDDLSKQLNLIKWIPCSPRPDPLLFFHNHSFNLSLFKSIIYKLI